MPKEKQQVRTPMRRAASKEALKQMHILLGDERKYEISSDDDVIEVEVQPPKKKYKVTNRKSADGNDRDVLVLKTVTKDESVFDLEVTIEELSEVQKSRFEQISKEDKEIESKIEQLLRAPNTEVIYNGVCTTAVEITEQLQSILGGVQTTVPGQSIVLQQQPGSGNTSVPQSYQLVMDPRLGVIVGAVSTTPNANAAPPLLYQPKVTVPTTSSTPAESTPKTRRGMRPTPNITPSVTLHKTGQAQQKSSPQPAKPSPQPKITPAKGLQVKAVATKTLQAKASPKATPPKLTRATTVAQQPQFRPSETSVEGGLSMGTKPKSIDLTSEDGKALPDSREVSFNKLQGRTYPSLVVVARPHLRVKDLTSDRGKLDVKVKSVLMYPPTKFTEWLIQQGLVRSDQKCSIHPANTLKLGMYSDASKFPYSGGYVWISECCPQRFVSVFSGSLFEGSQHPPMAILKLLYHWCCQTIVQNVTQWVKVDNLYVKGMYTWLRSICTSGLHTHVKQLGGPGVKVQVGVISLGTTTQDGNKREVKVEILGILETVSRHIRLRAVEPLADGEKNYKKRFSKILEPVFNWVHPSSIIVTDWTVDKGTLHQMGFANVIQNTSTDYNNSNRTIMEYLRRIVPRMFQNTLSLLSRQIIQQFLDELVWREWYGTTVLQCFDNMIQHVSEQTRGDSGQSLIVKLNRVSANPFKNWSVSINGTSTNNNTPTPAPVVAAPAPAKPVVAPATPDQGTKRAYNRGRKSTPATTTIQQAPVTVTQDLARPAKSISPDVPEQMVPLENYYYGTINSFLSDKVHVELNIKCPFCKFTFNSNVSLMNHLFKHAHNVCDDVQLCKYCLTIVPSAPDLLKHIATSHPDETKFDNGFVCLICEAHFRNPFILGKHMSREHCPSELPYICGTCEFRCSNHKQAVDHFYQQHENGATIQCPFCLKSTTVNAGGRNITQNMNFFIQHLQKHQKKHFAKRCGRCTLWFIQKEYLKDHQINMHASQRGKSGLVPSFAPRNGVMVPKSRMDRSPDDATVINFSTLFFNIGKNLNCKECHKSLAAPKHFSSFESCQNPNCQFSTCCSNFMQEHVAKCKFLNAKLPPEKLPYEMFCVCGYSDTCGNMMAKHLAICERKSAYPSKEAAGGAAASHSMLDVLGLVRRPDESSSKSLLKEVVMPSGRSSPAVKPRGRSRKLVKVESDLGSTKSEDGDTNEDDIADEVQEIIAMEGVKEKEQVPEATEEDSQSNVEKDDHEKTESQTAEADMSETEDNETRKSEEKSDKQAEEQVIPKESEIDQTDKSSSAAEGTNKESLNEESDQDNGTILDSDETDSKSKDKPLDENVESVEEELKEAVEEQAKEPQDAIEDELQESDEEEVREIVEDPIGQELKEPVEDEPRKFAVDESQESVDSATSDVLKDRVEEELRKLVQDDDDEEEEEPEGKTATENVPSEPALVKDDKNSSEPDPIEKVLEGELVSLPLENDKCDESDDLVQQTKDLFEEMNDFSTDCSDKPENELGEKMDVDSSLDFEDALESLSATEQMSLAVDDKLREKTADDIDTIANEMCPMDTD